MLNNCAINWWTKLPPCRRIPTKHLIHLIRTKISLGFSFLIGFWELRRFGILLKSVDENEHSSLFASAIESGRFRSRLLIHTAVEYFRSIGSFETAVEILESSCTRSPSDFWLWQTMASIFFEQGNYDEALRSCKNALRLKAPLDIDEDYFNIGVLETKCERYIDAIDSFKTAISKNPQCVIFYIWLAKCYKQEGQEDNAAIAFKRAKQLRADYDFGN